MTKLIITISGNIGAGKSTIASMLANRLGLKHYSTGDYMRQIAKKRGITLMELSKQAEQDDSIDKELDRWQEQLGQEEDDFVIDARLGYYFIPNSLKIFLKVKEEEGARRVFREKRSDNKHLSFEEVLANVRRREESQRRRYKEYYGIDFPELDKFDLVIDTTGKTPEKVADLICERIIEKKHP